MLEPKGSKRTSVFSRMFLLLFNKENEFVFFFCNWERSLTTSHSQAVRERQAWKEKNDKIVTAVCCVRPQGGG